QHGDGSLHRNLVGPEVAGFIAELLDEGDGHRFHHGHHLEVGDHHPGGNYGPGALRHAPLADEAYGLVLPFLVDVVEVFFKGALMTWLYSGMTMTKASMESTRSLQRRVCSFRYCRRRGWLGSSRKGRLISARSSQWTW